MSAQEQNKGMCMILYTRQKTQKKKSFLDGSLIVKRQTIFLRDEAGKTIDSVSITAVAHYEEDQFVDFPGHLVQLQDEGSAALLNSLRIRQSSTVSIPEPPQYSAAPQQPAASWELPASLVNRASQGQSQPASSSVQRASSVQPNLAQETAAQKGIPIEALKLYQPKTFYFSKNPGQLLQSAAELSSFQCPTAKSVADVMKNQLCMVTSELLIQITHSVLAQKLRVNQHGAALKLRQGNLVRKHWDMRFAQVKQETVHDAWKLEFSERINYAKGDMIFVLIDGNIIEGYPFFVSHYERKQQDFVYLEPLGAVDKLCTKAAYKLGPQKPQNHADREISNAVEFFHIEGFQNELNTLLLLLEACRQQNFQNKFCPVLTTLLLEASSKGRAASNMELPELDRDALSPLFLRDAEVQAQETRRLQTLNPHQRHAYEAVLGMVQQVSKRAHLVRGIFGSGKSQTLVQILRAAYQQFNFNLFKVLVIAVTNTAVDNIAERVLQDSTIPPNLVQRLGSGSQNEAVHDALVRQEFNPAAFLTLTTCASAARLQGQTFSLLVVDEASQLRSPDLLYLAANCKIGHAVFCGDPAQLPPVALQCGLRKSCLEVFLDAGFPVSNLWLQYRCNQFVAGLASKLFYKNQVETGSQPHWEWVLGEVDTYFKAPTPFQVSARPPVPADDEDLSTDPPARKTMIRVISAQSSLPPLLPGLCCITLEYSPDQPAQGSRANLGEAFQIARLVTYLVDTHQVLPSQVCVIVPYRAQASVLKQRLPDCIQIATVDSFQGDEKDVVIVGLTACQGTQFLEQGCRVNVAITRAKRSLIVFKSYTEKATGSMVGGYWSAAIETAQQLGWAFRGIDEFLLFQQKHMQELRAIQLDEQAVRNYVQLNFDRPGYEPRGMEVPEDEDKDHLQTYEKNARLDNYERLATTWQAYLQGRFEEQGMQNILNQRRNPQGFEIIRLLGCIE